MALEVPEFKSMEDVARWGGSLADEQIQSWKTEDWNAMFKKLKEFVIKSSEIEQRVPEYLSSKGLNHVVEALTELVKIQVFNQSPEGMFLRMKLYANYRMEPEQIEQINQLATEAGKKAAELGIQIDTSMDEGKLKQAISEIEKIVYEQTFYPDYLEKMRKDRYAMRAKILIEDSMSDDRLRGQLSSGVIIPEVTFAKADIKLEIVFHEFAHAHLQKPKYYSKNSVLRKHKPVIGVDTGLCQLMLYGHWFYLNVSNMNELTRLYNQEIRSGKSGSIVQTGKKIFQNGCKFSKYVIYNGNPEEAFAFLYGKVAAQSYCQTMQNISEKSLLLSVKSAEKD